MIPSGFADIVSLCLETIFYLVFAFGPTFWLFIT
jgi:hypothetical protein